MYIGRSTFTILTMLLLVAPSPPGAWATKYAGEFLDLRTGPKAMGMGGTGVSQDGDYTFLAWNPAATAHLEERQVSLMHSEMFQGLAKYDYLGIGLPLDGRGRGATLAFVLVRLGIDGIPLTEIEDFASPPRDDNVELLGYDSDAEYLLLMNWGRGLSERINVGSNVKIIYRDTVGHTCWGMGLDFGATYSPHRHLSIGLNVQDLPVTILFWDTGTTQTVLPNLKAGASYRFSLESMHTVITAAADLDIRFEGRETSDQFALNPASFDTHAGVEGWFNERVALRAGLDRGQLTGGVTLKIFSFDLDYAYMSHDDLGATYRLAGLFRF